MRGLSSFVYIIWPQFLSLTVETRIFKTFLLSTCQSEKKIYIYIFNPAMTAFTDQYGLPNIFFDIGQL